MGEGRVNNDSNHSTPNKESNNRRFCDISLFPSDFGVSNVADYNRDNCGDQVGKPEKIVVFD